LLGLGLGLLGVLVVEWLLRRSRLLTGRAGTRVVVLVLVFALIIPIVVVLLLRGVKLHLQLQGGAGKGDRGGDRCFRKVVGIGRRGRSSVAAIVVVGHGSVGGKWEHARTFEGAGEVVYRRPPKALSDRALDSLQARPHGAR
jgi:hypothetical protein